MNGGRALGTMGTPVKVLQQRAHHVAYRELWYLRNEITANLNVAYSESNAGSYADIHNEDCEV